MSSYKLTYFDNRIRAEPIRWIFAVAKQPYEDRRIGFKDWPSLKNSFLFGQIPLLEVDGKQIVQSQAIMNFLAREFGLAGKTPIEQARVNMIALTLEDALFRHSSGIINTFDTTKQAELITKYKDETLPYYLSKLEQLLISNDGGDGYFVGSELTYADLVIVFFCDEIENIFGFKADLEKYPKLAAHKIRVEANEGLADWLVKRPPLGDKTVIEMVSGFRRQQAAANAGL